MASVSARQPYHLRRARLLVVSVAALVFAASSSVCFEAPYSFHEVLQAGVNNDVGYQEEMARIKSRALKRAAQATASKLAQEQTMIREQQELSSAVAVFGDAVKKALSHAATREDTRYEAELQAQADKMKKRAAKTAALKMMQERVGMQEQQEQRELSCAVMGLGDRLKQFLGHAATQEKQKCKAQIRAWADAMRERASKTAAMQKTQEKFVMQEQQEFSAFARVFGDGAKKAREYAHAVDERAATN